jgi:hypothetical protein
LRKFASKPVVSLRPCVCVEFGSCLTPWVAKCAGDDAGRGAEEDGMSGLPGWKFDMGTALFERQLQHGGGAAHFVAERHSWQAEWIKNCEMKKIRKSYVSQLQYIVIWIKGRRQSEKNWKIV